MRTELDPFVRNMVYNRLAEEGKGLARWEETHVKHRFGPVFVILGVILFVAFAAANTPPVATFEVQASSDGSQTTLVFDATASYDPDGTIITYQWSYGDLSSGSGVTITHTFPSVSTYTVTLLITDNGGERHLISQTIDLSQPIAPQTPPGETTAPVPDIVIPYDISVGNRAGERAPAFALPNRAGEIVELADFLGHLVLVEFWSSSCSACVAAMPHLEALRAEFADRGLVVVTITINRDVEGEWQYLAQNGYTQFVSLRESDPIKKETLNAYGVSRIPHAFLIDYQGVIRFTGHLNLVQSDMIESLL